MTKKKKKKKMAAPGSMELWNLVHFLHVQLKKIHIFETDLSEL